ncbi:MAG: c-type cytochrome [Anaerolineae bacterium]|nr:c-type cytochrome [Anaerolineae bacterium]
MQFHARTLLAGFLILIVSTGIVQSVPLLAQGDGTCDVDALLEHEQEHAAALANLDEIAREDLDTALENLYITGIAYQSLAINCGFNRVEEASALHDAEHDGDAMADGAPMADSHDGHAMAPDMALAQSVGDIDNGRVLFNTLQPEVGFACATCHKVDTMERLIGPGLMGVGNPAHDPSEHAMSDMAMDDAADPGDASGGMDMGHAADGEQTMDMGSDDGMDSSMEMAMGADRDPVEYIRTSILDPGAYVVPSFPDNLMPRVYSEIFTEDEINDLIAYLLTL